MSSSSAPSAAAKKKPSLYARKLLEKLRTLNSNASLESRQTLANWMVFNRKKAEGIGEGLLLAIDAAVVGSTTDGGSEAPLSRLMLLLRVIHQVFIEGKDDSDVFEKSLQLRLSIADVALVSLFKALATTANNSSTAAAANESEWNNYQTEIKEMIDLWKEYNVFDGPTVWEGYKKAWGRALADANKEKSAAVVASAEEASVAAAGENDTTPATETLAGGNEVMDAKPEGEQSSSEGGVQQQISSPAQPTKLEANGPNVKNEAANENVDTAKEDVDMTDAVKKEEPPTKQEKVVPAVVDKEPDRRLTKRDSTASVASVEIDFDAEGVEEACVDPQKFLETSKVIASLQIARDLGSDVAMNLSSALASVPAEVEEACNTVYAKQQDGKEASVVDILSTDQLSNLPDEVLDIDLDYAKKSLHEYREAILQQRKARLQCLHLLLQSRCCFGSLDAAKAFGCDDGSDEGMDIILEKLKKTKEKLIDGMALEGLDVEEDADDEKRTKEEEEQLKSPSWFPGQSEDEPAPKKQKIA